MALEGQLSRRRVAESVMATSELGYSQVTSRWAGNQSLPAPELTSSGFHADSYFFLAV